VWRSPQSERRGRVAAAGVIAMALLGTSCVHADAPGIAVEKIGANISFGVQDANQSGAPNAGPIDQSLGQAVVDLGPPLFAFGPPRPRINFNKKSDPCPNAGVSAQPDAPASQTVVYPPPAGLFRWKKRGTITPANPQSPAFPLGGFEQRIVRGVSSLADDPVQRPAIGVGAQAPPPGKIFSYQTLEPDLVHTGQLIQSDFQVKSDAVQVNQFPPVAPPDPNNIVSSSLPTTSTTSGGPATLPTAPPTPGGITTGDPAHGLALTKWTFLDDKGDPVGTFSPSPAVLLFPLAEQVFPGLSFQGAGVDPITGATLVVNGVVMGRTEVDVCGALIQGWQVQASENYNGGRGANVASGSPPDTFMRSFNYVVSTNMGALIVREQYDETIGNPGGAAAGPADGRYQLDLTLGQTTPSPVPANATP